MARGMPPTETLGAAELLSLEEARVSSKGFRGLGFPKVMDLWTKGLGFRVQGLEFRV